MPKVIYPATKPAPGSAGKTAYWRWQKPIIDLNKCTRCGLCWVYCPDSAYTFDEDGYPVILYDWCKGCGICAVECPVDAIRMVDEYAER